MKITEEFPFEEEARYNQNPPKGLDSPDLRAYISLRTLYFLKENGGVDEDGFSEIRKGIVTAYNQDMDNYNLIMRCANVWNKAQAASIAYEKERTLENADRLYNAMYNNQ